MADERETAAHDEDVGDVEDGVPGDVDEVDHGTGEHTVVGSCCSASQMTE